MVYQGIGLDRVIVVLIAFFLYGYLIPRVTDIIEIVYPKTGKYLKKFPMLFLLIPISMFAYLYAWESIDGYVIHWLYLTILFLIYYCVQKKHILKEIGELDKIILDLHKDEIESPEQLVEFYNKKVNTLKRLYNFLEKQFPRLIFEELRLEYFMKTHKYEMDTWEIVQKWLENKKNN